MDASFSPQNNINGNKDEEEHLSDFVSSSSDVSSTDSVASSTSSDLTEDASSSTSSSDHLAMGPLYRMSSLMEQLPFKRGLSKHFQGKSQSFTSLSNVRCLEDLAKPENPYKKRLKSCKSYGGGLDIHTPKSSSRTISKKASKSSSCASLISKRNSLMGNKPPTPPHRASNGTPWFV